MELVSVVVPIYNAEEGLRECLNCIIQQLYMNMQNYEEQIKRYIEMEKEFLSVEMVEAHLQLLILNASVTMFQ